ncbi:MAG: EamA family transporter, partial [Candidatus Levyibacteriota bacterium]
MSSKRQHPLLEKAPAPVLVIFAIICYQLGAAIAKQLFGLLGPGGTVLFRVGFSALFLIIAQKGISFKIERKTLFWTILYGLSLAGMNFMFYSSFARIPLGVAATIEFAGPLAIAVMGSRKFIDFLWVIMAGIG